MTLGVTAFNAVSRNMKLTEAPNFDLTVRESPFAGAGITATL